MKRGWTRPLMSVAMAVAVTVTGTGCRRVSDALLGGVDSNVTSVSMSIPQVDTQDNSVYRIFVSAVDQGGNPLVGLLMGNFSILENGGPGVPIDVSPVQEPLYVVLVIDRSGSMLGSRTTAANTAAISLVNALAPNDYAALIEFSDTVNITSGFISDKTAMANFINAGVANGSTAVYDATVEGAKLLLGVHGRRMLLVLTDGDDNSSKLTVSDTIKNVNDRGLSANMVGLGGDAGGTALAQIASETGGVFAESITGADLTTIYLNILSRYQNLMAIRYRRRESGKITAYLNYGNLTASASKQLD